MEVLFPTKLKPGEQLLVEQKALQSLPARIQHCCRQRLERAGKSCANDSTTGLTERAERERANLAVVVWYMLVNGTTVDGQP
jgi:hypothetical protein